MYGAKSGKPKPAKERKQDTAARAGYSTSISGLLSESVAIGVPEAAYRGKESITYAWRPWNAAAVPAPTRANP